MLRTVLNGGESTEGSRGVCRRETGVIVLVLEKLNHSDGQWPWKRTGLDPSSLVETVPQRDLAAEWVRTERNKGRINR